MPENDPHAAGDGIIDLTDVIEEGSKAKNASAPAEGIDLGFQQELDDLFTEGGVDTAPKSAPAPAQAASDDLDIGDMAADLGDDADMMAEELPKTAPAKGGEGGIDVAGLDALLEDGALAGGAMDDGAPFAAQAEDEAPGLDPAALDDLDSLLASTELSPDLEADIPVDGPQDAELIDLDSLMTEAGLDSSSFAPDAEEATSASVSDDSSLERLAAIEAKLEQVAAAQHLSIMELVDTIKQTPPASVDADALAAALGPALAGLTPAPDAQDAQIANCQKSLGERLSALEDKLAGLIEAIPSLVAQSLGSGPAQPDTSGADLVKSITTAVNDALETHATWLRDELAGKIEKLSAHNLATADGLRAEMTAKIDNLAAHNLATADGLRDELSSRIEKIAADNSAAAGELRAEIDKAVPAAAAKIIREEIDALVKDL